MRILTSSFSFNIYNLYSMTRYNYNISAMYEEEVQVKVSYK